MSRGVPAEVNLTVCVSACLFQLYLLIGCNATTNSFYRLLAAFSWILIRAWICKLKFCSRFMASFTYIEGCCSLFRIVRSKICSYKFSIGPGVHQKAWNKQTGESRICQSGTMSWRWTATCTVSVECWIFEEHCGSTSNLEKYAPQIFGIVV